MQNQFCFCSGFMFSKVILSLLLLSFCFLAFYHKSLRFLLRTVKKIEKSSWAVLSLNIMINDTITNTTVKTFCA